MPTLGRKPDDEKPFDLMLDLVPMGLALGVIIILFVIAEAIITRWP